jgi:hypothetical protein
LLCYLWANVYLGPFDHLVKRELRCRGYARYVDDILLFSDSKQELWRWKRAAIERLETLRLTLHRGAHPRPVEEGIPFLGFVVYPDQRRLKRRKGVAFLRALRQTLAAHEAGSIDTDTAAASVRGWLNHLSFASTAALRAQVLELLPPEIRCLLEEEPSEPISPDRLDRSAPTALNGVR